MTTANVFISLDAHGYFSCEVPKDLKARKLLRSAGMLRSLARNKFYTSSISVAARLREYCDSKTQNEISKVMLDISPWAGRIPHPKGLKPIYYQPIAAKFALSRNRFYLAMAAGLGKTPTVALYMNALYHKCAHQFVYVCPPFLVRNVENELNTWCPHIGVEHFDDDRRGSGGILIVPDSLFIHREMQGALKQFFEASPRALIVDEAHRFKNDESERTRILLGHTSRSGVKTPAIVDLFNRVGYMSGTCMPNRTLELFPILNKSAPETIDFMTKEEYGLKFCAGRWNGHGMDYSGSSNVSLLAQKVQGTFMFRLRKSALKLPPITEEVFVVSDDLPGELIAFESALLKAYSPEDLEKGRISAQYQFENMHLMTYQRLLGLKKVPHVVSFLDDFLEASDETILVFVKHIEVLEQIEKRFGDRASYLSPNISVERRFEFVEDFQRDKRKRILVGPLKKMGIGLNITRATRILNVEPDWSPATNEQGSDRIHRYGQLRECFVQYMCYKNSVDKRVLDVVLRKRKLATHF
jgi:hypothetical protein